MFQMHRNVQYVDHSQKYAKLQLKIMLLMPNINEVVVH